MSRSGGTGFGGVNLPHFALNFNFSFHAGHEGQKVNNIIEKLAFLLYNYTDFRAPFAERHSKEAHMTGNPGCDTPTPIYAYKIKNAIYVNTTTYCSNVCEFCIKFFDRGVAGYDLSLAEDPGYEQTVAQIDTLAADGTRELVFCGLGESTYRMDFIEKIARLYKAKGFRIRLNSNGHGNHINGADIVPRLAGFIDSISISLNAHTREGYDRICNPSFEGAYEEMLEFSKKCVKAIPEVWLTVVDIPGVNIAECEKIAATIGAKFRIRPYIPQKRSECGMAR